MSILAVIHQPDEAEGLTRWARQVAIARREDLQILVIRVDPATEEEKAPAVLSLVEPPTEPDLLAIHDVLLSDEAEMEDACEVKVVTTARPLECVLNEQTGNQSSLVIVGKQRSHKGDTERSLPRMVFRRAPCEVLLLRLGETAGMSCDEILVPVSGGPHSLGALRLGSKIIQHFGGKLTALFVESESDEDAQEVGDRMIGRLLDQAGVERDEHVEARAVVAHDTFAGIRQVVGEGCDLMIIGASDGGRIRRILFGAIPERFLKGEASTTVAVYRSARPLIKRVQESLERWLQLSIPQLSREERIALFETLRTNSRWNFDFLTLLGLSTAIAALGLIQSSTAVVIGAMLVAPLMTPLIGIGLALAQGNIPLLRIGSKAVLLGFLTAVGISYLMGALIPIPVLTPELAARGAPTVLDLGVAFLSGYAAAYCVGRPNLSGALPGVAIAAALVPPIATTGIALAMGETEVASGAAVLFGTNVVAIVLGAAISLYLGGARGKREREGRGKRWAQRTVIVLVMIVVVEAIPLASYLLAQWSSSRPSATAVPTSYAEHLKARLKAYHEARLVSVKRQEGVHVLGLVIEMAGPQAADDALVRDLADHARGHFGRDVRVQVISRLERMAVAPRLPKQRELEAPEK